MILKAKDRFSEYETICLQCGITIYKPYKELTDEDIDEVYNSIPEIKGYAPIYEFARAILKKASEK
jgi:hypothetical protein